MDNPHEVAIELEELDFVKRVDTEEGRLDVVFDRDDATVDDFNEVLDPDYYEGVLEVFETTIYQEEPPVGNKFVETYPRKGEVKLLFVK